MKKSHLSTRVDKIVILNLFGLNNRQPPRLCQVRDQILVVLLSRFSYFHL